MRKRLMLSLGTVLLTSTPFQATAQTTNTVGLWLTTADRSSLFAEQSPTLSFHKRNTDLPTIEVNDKVHFQQMDGFGFALTGGSAELLMRMTPASRTALLKELFTTNGSSIGVSYLRVSIGASDMNERVFTYDDLPSGKQDPNLEHFDLGPDRADVVPVLREILAINPSITILGSPWSPPSWMKTNDAAKAGSLRPEDYAVYAQYFVKYIQAMAAEGIHIDAVTVQNEPLNPKNTPSLFMPAHEEGEFIKSALGPAFQAAGIHTKIFLYDHNCDKPEYPLEILADPKANPYVAGSAFHLYGGQVSAMTQVHNAYPQKNVYFTEQMVIENEKGTPFKIQEPVSRVVIGATTNWSRNVLLWNLAADPQNGPHTADGGCPICQGAITLDGDTVTRNLAFYTIAHASKFVRPGSVRIESIAPANPELAQVAFETPEHRTVLLVANKAAKSYSFNVLFKGKEFSTTLAPGAVGTYVW
ncbi:MAG: glycoside hydrolase family 30 protein [Janthinobacterium lividum]